MASAITLRRPGPVDWTRSPPGSKSITNRALLLAAIARGKTRLVGWLDADDTQIMRRALTALGIAHGEDDTALRPTGAESGAIVVHGTGGVLPAAATTPDIHVGTAGTVARFLLAVAAASPGTIRMDGSARMRERPMDMLIDTLRSNGARIEEEHEVGFLPVRVGPNPRGLAGGEIRLQRPDSSQFVSGLALAATLARAPTRIVLEQGTPARPYVDMTFAVMKAFGCVAGWDGDNVLTIEPGVPTGCDYGIEPDASAASYPLALAAIYGGKTTIPRLGTASLQGDVAFVRALAKLGARVTQTTHETQVEGTGELRGGTFDLGDIPDTTLTLAVAALFARGTTEIRGVEVLRHHESDRLSAGATELRKLGATVTEHPDGLTIEPPANGPNRGVDIETYLDHRMAMAFSLAGDVTILDPGCVAKTYPQYFQHLAELGMVAHTR